MKKITFYLFTIIIILGAIYVLIKSDNETKSTIAYLVAMFSFFFGPGAFIKLKDWCFGKSSSKLIIENVGKTFSPLIRNDILQGYIIEIGILNVGQLAVIKRICLNTDKGLFQMQLLGSSELSTGEKTMARYTVNPAKFLEINKCFAEDYYGNKWIMDKAEVKNLTQSFKIFLKDLERHGYALPTDFYSDK